MAVAIMVRAIVATTLSGMKHPIDPCGNNEG
jgi:hypothetical protein